MEHQKRKKLGLVALEKRLMLDASLPIIAGQIVWLDAADTSTILDAQGDNAASGAAFSGNVTTWLDKSGSNYHVSTIASEQPDYGLTSLNGHGVISFNGTSDRLLNSTALIPGNAATIFVVFNRTTGTGRDGVVELGSGASRNAIFINEAGSNHINYYSSGSFSNLSATYTPGTYTMLSVAHDGTNINAWNAAANQLSGTATVRSSTTGLYVGDDSSSGDQLQGNIAEIIVYDHALTALERHDVENYLASKWGLTETNTAPTLTTNTGTTANQGASRIINSAMLAASDVDNSPANLVYTITDLPDHGILENLNTGYPLGLGDTFRQFDINSGYIRYTHDNTGNLADAFSFTVTDQYATTSAATFSLTVNPSNMAPVLSGWTQISSENFESGATGWSDNTTEIGNAYLTRFLGRHSLEGGAQNTFKTYTLSGTQDQAVFTFDMYELDSWDGESFRIYINDVAVFNTSLSAGAFNSPSDGSFGNVSWTVQETTPFNANFTYGAWADQIYRFTLTVDTTAAAVKIGFSSTLDQATSDEAWGVDNINLYEVRPNTTPGPYEVIENAANGTVVGHVKAYDPNAGDTLTYSITGGSGVGIFTINATTGAIIVANSAMLNYEVTTSYTLDIRVQDNGIPIMFDTDTVTINILDMPENTAPTIPAAGPFTIAENIAVNTVVGSVPATDAEGNAITYSISGGNTAGVFSINSAGVIRIASTANINYEAVTSYTLTIQAADNGFGSLASSRNVTINVTNVNEAPVFDPITNILAANPGVYYNAATGNFYRFVSTGATFAAAQAAANAALLNGTAGHLVTVTTAAENTFVRSLINAPAWMGGTDTAVEGQWQWGAGGAEAGQIFWLGGTGGSVQNGLYQNWTPGTQPDDSGGNEDYLQMLANGQWNDVPGTNSIGYVIEWEGTAPIAAIGNGPYTIAENSAAATSVGFAHSSDPDVGDTRVYSITGGTGSGIFAINATTGEITLTGALNYEAINSYTLNLRVQDVGGLFDTTTVTVNVTDVNETPSLNAAGPFNFNENTAIGTLVTTMSASDPDTGQTLTYSIQSGNTGNMFAINGATGALTFAGSPNYENVNAYSLAIRVTDNGTGALFAQRTVTIGINPLNEAPIFDPVQSILALNPNLRYNATTGNFYQLVTTAANLATARANAAAAMVNGVAGHLVTITSATENAFVRSLVSGSSLWLDATDAAVEGSWRWMSGPEAGQLFWLGTGTGSAQNGFYTNWNGGEPNDSAGNEDGSLMLASGSWNDSAVGGTAAYVIEWEGATVTANLQNGPYAIDENSALGTSVGFAHSADPDAGDTRVYSITGGSGSSLFAINATTGEITLTGALNYEASSSYTLNLRVQDVGGLFDTTTVTININDLNDVPVLSPAGPFTFNENVPIGTAVTTMSASDQDVGQTLTYSIQSGNTGNMFAINSATGALTFAGSPNYENVNAYNLVIRVTDNGTGALFAQQTVNIGINPLNEAPIFDPVQSILALNPNLRYNATTGNFYEFVSGAVNLATARANSAASIVNGTAGHLVTITSAAENTFVRSLLTTASTWIDASDAAVEGEWRWMSGPEAGQLFWLGTGTGSAQNGFYTSWNGGEPNDSSGEDGVQLFSSGGWNDINVGSAFSYVIEWEGATVLANFQNGPYAIDENTPAGTSVGFAHSADPDAGDTRVYSITGGSGSSMFAINATTGEITLSGVPNYEVASSYTLNLRVQDAGGLFDTTTVTININDLNEVPVLSPAGPFNFNENIAIGTSVTTMSAADQDGGQTLTYTIQSGNTGGMFAINSATGEITFAGSPDYETVNSYNLVVRVTDDGTGNLYAEQTVDIAINDLNEVPVLSPAGPFTVNENVPIGTVVTTMVAADQDGGQTLTYTIQSGNTGSMFTINASTGALTFAGSPNYEVLNAYSLVIRVTDNGTGTLYAEQTVDINIADINDVPDVLSLSYNRVTENVPAGTLIGLLSTIDQDPLDTHTYSLITNPGSKFVIVGNELRTAAGIDYEQNQSFNVTIRTDDGNGGLLNRNFIILVNDVQDTFTPPPAPPEPSPTPVVVAPDNGVPKSTSLVMASLQGGEAGQALAFYGMGDFHQILRENITFEIRDISARPIDDETEAFSIPDFSEGNDMWVDRSDDTAQSDRFTNLREALKFFEQIKDAEKRADGDAKEASPQQERDIPANTIDRQFVDVLTYHEQKQARLREALKG